MQVASEERDCLHESIVNGDNEDLSCGLKLGVCDVAGNVVVGACWAWTDVSDALSFSSCGVNFKLSNKRQIAITIRLAL